MGVSPSFSAFAFADFFKFRSSMQRYFILYLPAHYTLFSADGEEKHILHIWWKDLLQLTLISLCFRLPEI